MNLDMQKLKFILSSVLFPSNVLTYWKFTSVAASISIHSKVSPGGNCKTLYHEQVLVFFWYSMFYKVKWPLSLHFVSFKTNKKLLWKAYSLVPFIQSISIFLWVFILIDFSSTNSLRKRKLEQKIILAYVNEINIIAYKNICGEREWAWGEASDKEIETDFFQCHK